MSRTKDQWIEETGGFRLGETPEQFKKRTLEINNLRAAVQAGTASAEDVNLLAALMGSDTE
ncbi:MAG: hypothetical protein AB7S81_08080 [Bdellovibrionales bacterium]